MTAWWLGEPSRPVHPPEYYEDDREDEEPYGEETALAALRVALRERHAVPVARRLRAWRTCWYWIGEVRDGSGPRSYAARVHS